jgi:hypothetical protein
VVSCAFTFPRTLLRSTIRNLPGKQSSACCAVAPGSASYLLNNVKFDLRGTPTNNS